MGAWTSFCLYQGHSELWSQMIRVSIRLWSSGDIESERLHVIVGDYDRDLLPRLHHTGLRLSFLMVVNKEQVTSIWYVFSGSSHLQNSARFILIETSEHHPCAVIFVDQQATFKSCLSDCGQHLTCKRYARREICELSHGRVRGIRRIKGG